MTENKFAITDPLLMAIGATASLLRANVSSARGRQLAMSVSVHTSRFPGMVPALIP
jgi:hypothetical protein